MSEKIPYPVYDRPLQQPTLSEQPRLLQRLPNHTAVINAYNSGLNRLLDRGDILQTRFNNGEFDGISAITAKIEAKQTLTADEQLLVRDMGTLLDARDGRYGRRLLNIANYLAANQFHPSTVEAPVRVNYQAGQFQKIAGFDHTLYEDAFISRFVVPATEYGISNGIEDGAPVEGIIRELDRLIAEKQATHLSLFNLFGRCLQRRELRQLRQERDILYTSSKEIYRADNNITHARKQYEAYLKSIDPFYTEWEKPDWYKIELSLKDRRVLNVSERGRERWCLPACLAIPLLAAIPIFNLCKQPERLLIPVPGPVVIGDICFGIAGGKARSESFKNPNGSPLPSFTGHIQRELAYVAWGMNQRVYRAKDDEVLLEGLNRLRTEEPDVETSYLKIARADSYQAESRFVGPAEKISQDEPFIITTDFPDDNLLVVSCLTPEQRLAQARAEVALQTTSR